uniref:Uncharacterized protein n=1 Tax=Anguilla anguilla TaxID=7936 RepID=A0A0E9TL41_ANGAN
MRAPLHLVHRKRKTWKKNGRN